MNEELNKKAAGNDILENIKAGKIQMQPRWHFVLKIALLSFGAIVVLSALLYVASFMIFTMRQTGIFFTPFFGIRGWQAFFMHLPWMLVFFVFIFIAILEILARRYSFVYRRPLVYSLLGIALIAAAGGIIIANTPFHNGLSGCAEADKLPFAGPAYRDYNRQKLRDIHRGKIMEMKIDGFKLRNRRDENLQIIITRKTRFPFGADFLEGDSVVVFGDRNNDMVRAFGVQKIEEPDPVNFCH